MTDIYIRADGTAADRTEAIGPETDATKCLTIAAYKAGSKSVGDTLLLSALGGDLTGELPTYANDVTMSNIGSGLPFVESVTNQAFSTGALRSGVTYDAIDGEGVENVISVTNLNGATVENCNFTGKAFTTAAIRTFGDSVLDSSSVLINNNSLIDPSASADLMTWLVDAGRIDDVVITNNYQRGGSSLFFANGTAGITNGALGFAFTDNTADDLDKDIVITGYGIAWDGTEAGRGLIARNVANNLGSLTTLNTNSFGLQWCIGVICEDNIANGLAQDPAAQGDGSGFIVDWGFRDNAYISDGVILRRNIANGCKSYNQASGIITYKAKNTKTYCNLCFDNSIGLKCVGGNTNFNNAYHNNTIVDSIEESVLINPILGEADLLTHVYTNNIFYNGKYNIIVNNQTLNPELSTNCYYGATISPTWNAPNGAIIPIGTGSIELDPLFVDEANGDYNLQENSPCVGIGAKWWGNDPRPETLNGEPLPDEGIDLGAYQSTWHPRHPANI